MFPCCKCDKLLTSKCALNDHKRKKHNFETIDLAKVFKCGHCKVSFTKSCNLLRHQRIQRNSSGNYQCFSCPTYFGSLSTLIQHQEQYHSDVSLGRPNINVSDLLNFTTEAVNSKFQIHRLKLEDSDRLELFNYIISQKDRTTAFVNSLLSKTPNVKLGLSIAVKMEKPLESEVVEAFFNSAMSRSSSQLTDVEYLQHVDALMTQLIVFATGGSGWVVGTLTRLEIKTVSCSKITGGSYIQTPPILKPLNGSILNVVNKRDNFCFLYCVAAALFSFIGRANRPKTHKKNIERLSFNSKLMAMPLSAIPSFEKRNRCSINVYQMQNPKLVSVYHSKNRRGRHKIDLPRLMDNKNSHYGLIKNFSNLVHFLTRSRMKHDKGPKSRFCRNCFQPIIKKNFKKHVSFCESNAPLEIRMPLESLTIEFVNWEKTQKCPFVVYCALEAINVAIAQFPHTKCRTRDIERQYAASFGAVLVDYRS